MAEDIEMQIKILSNSKEEVYDKLAQKILDTYEEEIWELDEVFAFGYEVESSHESATGKMIKIIVEPAEKFESLDEKHESEKEFREKFYNIGDLDQLRDIITVKYDFGGVEEDGEENE
jgi:hypothetical protein